VKPVAVLQNEADAPAGYLGITLDRLGLDWYAVRLDTDEPVPSVGDVAGVAVLGGAMGAYDEEAFPFLADEKRLLAACTERGVPVLGICLGCQLLADALGGTCGHQQPPEVGVLEVALTSDGLKDPIFSGMPAVQRALQWHSVQVLEPPDGAVVLAASDVCPVQAVRVGRHAWSMQYHVEVEPDTVSNWGVVPAYRAALESTLGPTALAGLVAVAEQHMNDFVANAECLYDNFMEAVRQVL
jgi:GMP synthase-like glutamine amidotransferase